MVAAKNDGPDLPPITPGLIHTPIEALHNLFGVVFFQALNECDRDWVESPDFLLVAEFANIDEHLALRVRRMFLAGQIKAGAFSGLAPATPWERSQRQETANPSRPAEPHHIGPVALVRSIAAAMLGASHGEMVRACVTAGINYSTADAQVRKYRKALAESNN
ncbi:hypothetical protein WGP40_09870 [Brachymonas sp. G13]|uniref:hypothetical protein n=1 Tax=Brachymonas wangyanguii TaxID=3130163 RepID=UPI00307DF1DC